MAFLDNTGLERFWQHICAKFAPKEHTYQLQHPNILDNSDFTKLITYRENFPREKKEYNTKMSFKFDRWKSSTKVIVEEDEYITLQSAADPEFARLHQGMPLGTLKNIVYTVVVTLLDGTKFGGTIDLTTATNSEVSIQDGDFQFILQKNVNSTYDRFRLRYTGSTNVNIINIGLYEGAYTTLPDYRSRLLVEERQRCLRYFRRINSVSTAGWANTKDNLRVVFPIEVPLRAGSVAATLVKSHGSIRGCGEKIETATVDSVSLGASEITVNIGSYTATGSTLSETALKQNETYCWVGGQIGFDSDFE